MNDRINKEEYFMRLAETAALRSTCTRHQIGAVLVKDCKVVSTGYNGSPKGMAHCMDIKCMRDERGIKSGEHQELCRAVHAEMNAMLQAREDLEGATLYCTIAPCVICTKMLINAGVKRIVYTESYPDELSLEMLDEAGIEVIQQTVAETE